MKTTKNLSIDGLPQEWQFPTTRYRGSKRKILPWIWGCIKDLQFDSALDLFGGTGSVSLLLKRMGKKVVFNDYLRFNYLSGVAFIENSTVQVTTNDLEFLLGHHSSVSASDFIARTFHRHYYRANENKWLDQFIANIHALSKFYKGTVLQQKQAIAIWSLGQACLIKRPFNLFHRRNLALRVRSAERNFGNKTTWDTPFPDAFLSFISEANASIFDNGIRNKAMHSDSLKVAQAGYGLVYLDPPYFFPEQTDFDYRDLYHFLEGISLYEKWPHLIDYSTHNLRLAKNGIHWPVHSETELTKIYASIVSRFKDSIIVISHKSGSTVPVGAIRKMLTENGKSVQAYWKRYKYALSKSNGEPRSNIEWLIIGS